MSWCMRGRGEEFERERESLGELGRERKRERKCVCVCVSARTYACMHVCMCVGKSFDEVCELSVCMKLCQSVHSSL